MTSSKKEAWKPRSKPLVKDEKYWRACLHAELNLQVAVINCQLMQLPKIEWLKDSKHAHWRVSSDAHHVHKKDGTVINGLETTGSTLDIALRKFSKLAKRARVGKECIALFSVKR